MRIAVASEGLDVSPHFGHCANYNYFTIEDGMIVEGQNLPSAGGQCGSAASLMRELDVDVVVTGGIGEKAKEALERHGIEVIAGVTGEARGAVLDYLSGTLRQPEALCAGSRDCR